MIGKFCLAALCLTAALLFYGCAPTVTVNGETFEPLTPREEKDLVLIARAALKRSTKAVGLQELRAIEDTEPEVEINYYGDRTGDAKVTWTLPDHRRTVQFRGQLLTDHMVVQTYTVRLYDGIIDYSKGKPVLRREPSQPKTGSDPGNNSLEDLLRSPAR